MVIKFQSIQAANSPENDISKNRLEKSRASVRTSLTSVAFSAKNVENSPVLTKNEY